MNNLHIFIPGPEKIIKEADKLKINSEKIAELKTKGRASANF